jgi:nucleotide-binding universal stress UspA family protein
MRSAGAMQTVVVGVDGSKGAEEAVAFAAKEAVLRKLPLLVVCAWEIPALADMSLAPLDVVAEGLAQEARGIVARAIAQATALEPSLHCESEVREGQAADVLLGAAQGAALLVVGHRGLGGFTALLLGSVSMQVVQHAHCPVAVVRRAES